MSTSSGGRYAKSRDILAAALGLTLGVAALSPWPAFARDGAAAKSVCLDGNRIDHTQVLNSHQILFYMLGREIWVNNLTGNCVTLTPEDGFVWVSSIGKYCDNLETIRVVRTGEVCLLGAFTPYEKPPAS